MFIPPNTSTLLQPLDQGIISTFKAYYLKKTREHLVSATSTNKDSFFQFGKILISNAHLNSFINLGLKCHQQTINGSWKKLWPECVRTSIKNICPEEKCIQETIEISHRVRFEEVAMHDIIELFASHNEELTNDELLQIETLSYAEELSNTAAMELTDKDANTLIDQDSTDTSNLQDYKQKLFSCLQAADHLKELMPSVESDKDRLISLNSLIDAAMSFYRNKHDKM